MMLDLSSVWSRTKLTAILGFREQRGSAALPYEKLPARRCSLYRVVDSRGSGGGRDVKPHIEGGMGGSGGRDSAMVVAIGPVDAASGEMFHG